MANIENINLNLLKSLNSLLSEKNVSRAALREGVTQSAMSISLSQLRGIYQDDLLVRGPKLGVMQLTAFGKSLVAPVREAIRQVESLFVQTQSFDYAHAEKTFHIGMSDYIAFVLLPKLMRKITYLAPNIKIVQHAVNHLDTLTPFEDFNIDIVIGDFKFVPKSLKTTNLFTDTGVIVADKNHPAFRDSKLTTKRLLAYPQVFVALESQPEQNFIAEMLKRMGYTVKISLMTPHTLIALQTLPGTNLMTNTVEGLAKPFIDLLGLAMRNTPYKLPKYTAKMYWHVRDQNDQGHRWIRELIKEISRNL